MNTIKRISFWIERCYSLSLILVSFIVVFGFFWLFNFSPLPLSNSEFIKLSGREGLLDTMLFYSAREAHTALTHYGTVGRKLYLEFLATDFLFISVYSFAFALLITRTVRAVCANSTLWLSLNLLPLGIGLLDCLENLCILGMLYHYPINTPIIGTISGVATLCKWLLTIVAISCLMYGGIVLLMRWLGFNFCPVHRFRKLFAQQG